MAAMGEGGVRAGSGASPPLLLGRGSEQEKVDRLLVSVRAGLGRALVLHGEPGIGKTALLEHAVGSAPDMQVARVVGVESEIELPFAGLHALLRPFAGDMGSLPAPQRHALGVAFGQEAGEVNRLLVGLGTLTLLSTAGSVQPVLCVVDDAQWVDRESADALAFVARRLDVDAVGMLVAHRDQQGWDTAFEGLPELALGGLGREEATALLGTVAGPLGPGVVDRVVAETGGNPLALIELGAGLGADQLAAQASLPEPLPIGRQLEERFVAQVRELPPSTQALLLAVAVDTTGDPVLLFTAGRRLGFGIEAAEPAEAAGILVVEPRLAFRHPLIRSAVYHAAPLADRRRAHDALAEEIDADDDPDRRAWHRAEAVVGRDEDVALELERAAVRAKSRGGCAAAASFLTRSAVLSVEPGRRAARLLGAAEEELAAGSPERARSLLAQAVPGLVSPLERARATALEGSLLVLSGTPGRAAAKVLEAASAMGAVDIRRARAALLDAMAAAVFAGDENEGADVGDVGRAALAMPVPPSETPTVEDWLLDGHAAFYTGDFPGAAARWREALTALRNDPTTWTLRTLWFGAWAALSLGDLEALSTLSRACETLARAQGAGFFIPRVLDHVVIAELASGSLIAATEHAREAREVDPSRSDRRGVNAIAVCWAWSGRGDEVRAEVELGAREAPSSGSTYHLAVNRSALALLELSRGNYDAAWATMPRARDLYPVPMALVDYVEAAVRTGNDAAARKVISRFEPNATVAGTPLMLGILAVCQAMLATDEEADARYQESINLLDEAKADGLAARSRLVYGEWLRRARRRTDARDQLRLALATFETIGADGFAERTRAELLATGERVSKRKAVRSFELTPQEAQVAHLAADGATNAEIATRLFISPNTVDYHLRKVYPKLGVSSRVQLARALAAP
jgi:DNA-binding CsgD family transcriptional regulator/tetratricopeptide (TPR) repeat protein